VNRPILRIGVIMLVLYTVLFAQLNNLQLFGAQRLNNHPQNSREAARDFERSRGLITTADGLVIARSVETPDGPAKRRREYPEGFKYAHLTGFFSRTFGSSGIEREYNDELSGKTLEQKYGNIEDLFDPQDRSGNVTLTVDSRVQQAAIDSLGFTRGSVVAIDPRDGSILALWSVPAYDPNPLSDPDTGAAQDAKELLDDDPNNPLLERAYREIYFPGSTFKIVTASAGLESGRVNVDSPDYPRTSSYTPPLTTRPLRNFGGSTCGGTLFAILEVSCNSSFAQMGAEQIGPEGMVERAEAFGFNDTPPIDLPNAASSRFPTDFGRRLQTVDAYYAQQNGQPPPTTIPGAPEPVYIHEDTPRLAQTAIGQNDVAATPLQMAMVAAAIANDGKVMAPHVMKEIREQDGSLLDDAEPELWHTATSPATAQTMRDAMINVVDNGTASRMAIPGVVVGGKTGTAQLGTDPPKSHAWIIGFAGRPGEPASVAVAVLVEAQDGASEQTGGRVAAPIAKAVLEAALAAQAAQ
jgi:peptidoglycan glycosyltransferase